MAKSELEKAQDRMNKLEALLAEVLPAVAFAAEAADRSGDNALVKKYDRLAGKVEKALGIEPAPSAPAPPPRVVQGDFSHGGFITTLGDRLKRKEGE